MKYGIIGLGNHSVNRVMPSIVESGSQITGITTANKEKGAKLSESFSCRYFNTYDEMLKSDIDCVYVGSPNFLHYEHAMKAIKNGKHVLMEKPMTLKSLHARELIEASKDHKVSLGVGFHLRAHPAISKLKKNLQENGGQIKFMNGAWAHKSTHSANPTTDSKWWTELDKVGGGSVMGTGVHVLDTLLNIAGKFPRKVSAFSLPETSIIDTTMAVYMQFDSFIGNAFSSRETDAVPNDLAVTTEEHEYRVKNFFSTSIDYVFTVDGKSKSKGSEGNIYLEEVREFEKMVDGKDSLIAKAKDGYNVVRVVEDAHKSISMSR
ncbi:MAG: Gfo/Idh/MocA family oxidoreductase [Candidatus Thermoplasmatota archaeon]|jgi:predicted dehydrogenase|nr:Gfo/Idh/MocA family oxidoreductase [Candidatus Thermoplasmatota archaeon]MCL5988253.1 Gfo/Idh/MocA family oxidoreductase [Candidatus Thermoplasmatota archaeon]